ncbi:hypothetical protein V8G54_010648, partial [Vigna mungo]
FSFTKDILGCFRQRRNKLFFFHKPSSLTTHFWILGARKWTFNEHLTANNNSTFNVLSARTKVTVSAIRLIITISFLFFYIQTKIYYTKLFPFNIIIIITQSH